MDQTDVPIRPQTDAEKRHKCGQCDKSFARKEHLTRHVKTHTGEKPFKCDVCEKCFSRKSNLEVHFRSHTGENPYKCDQCDKCYAQKSALNSHLKTHTGEKHKCDKCGRFYVQKGALNAHIKTHTGERPFACDQCDKSFFSNGDLAKHILTHTGEKRYSCNQCDKAFARKYHLNRHIRTHVGDKWVQGVTFDREREYLYSQDERPVGDVAYCDVSVEDETEIKEENESEEDISEGAVGYLNRSQSSDHGFKDENHPGLVTIKEEEGYDCFETVGFCEISMKEEIDEDVDTNQMTPD